jgi:toxin ParE1/3/4
MKHARFAEPAAEEMARAAAWYEDEKEGLGEEFLDQVRVAVAFLEEFPDGGKSLRGGFRRKMLRRFPFALIYVVKADELEIRAVMHLHRKPGYWLRRDR